MPSTPLFQVRNTSLFKNLRLVATDMDGTLTQAGKFTAAVLQSLEQLAAAGIPVLVITGRSAGWVSGLATYLPVMGAIAENGALFYGRDRDLPQFLTPIPDPQQHRQQLAQMFAKLQSQFPGIQPSSDNPFRIADWTFTNHAFSPEDLQTMSDLCHYQGWGFTYSSVQCHIKPLNQDKATGLLQVLQDHFPHLTPDQVLTVGDSPNDESLFDASHFPHSVGVANISHYTSFLNHHPTYITAAAEGEGFCELAQCLLQASDL